MKKDFTKITFISLLAAPALAYAADAFTILTTVDNILRQVIPILMILATIVFLWGVISYVLAAGDEERKKTAKGYILWGLIGLAAMIAVWGVVRALIGTFGVGGGIIPPGPGDIRP